MPFSSPLQVQARTSTLFSRASSRRRAKQNGKALSHGNSTKKKRRGLTWNGQKRRNKRKILTGKGESKDVASRKRKERMNEIWEERSRPFPPLTCTLPAVLCSQHPCEAAREAVQVLSPPGQTVAGR